MLANIAQEYGHEPMETIHRHSNSDACEIYALHEVEQRHKKLLSTVEEAVGVGLSVWPPKSDGSKAPFGKWKDRQYTRASLEELLLLYRAHPFTGIGVICGAVSGNTVCFEFDDRETYEAFKEVAIAAGLVPLLARIEAGYLEYSPNGVHWLLRCPTISGSQKLATRPKSPEEMKHEHDKTKTLIETKGEGGLIIIAPTYGDVNPAGNYELISGGLSSIATITPEEWQDLLTLARTFDVPSEHTIATERERIKKVPSGGRPGDDFNSRATWAEIIPDWTKVYERNGVTYVRRPGKNVGVSATIGYAGLDNLYVFTTSSSFEPNRSYTKFAAYTVLHHSGDFSAAAKELAQQGYGNDDIDQERAVDDEAAASAVESLNRRHAIVMVGGKCSVLNEIIEPSTGNPDVSFSMPQDFRSRYMNQKIRIFKNAKVTEVSIADIWLNSPQRREFEGITFDPTRKVVEGYYNLFRGLAVEPKAGSWQRMKHHIYEVICNGDNATFHYLQAWMARIVQFPGGTRPGVVPVLRGRQGTGKGCFVTNFGKIFGNHFYHIISHTLVTGRFNSHFKDALFVFVDESFWGGDKQAEGALKGMITEDYILVEPKFKDAIKIKNHANFIFASNAEWVVPAALEERRFCVLDVSDKYQENRAYFNAISDEMEHGGVQAMLHDLLKLDISGTDLRRFPRNEALFDQIIQSMHPVNKFWFEILRAGRIVTQAEKYLDFCTFDWPSIYPCDRLYGLYVEFAKLIGERYQVADTTFGKKLRELCNEIKRKQVHTAWQYVFPSLEECRDAFERLVKMPIDWGPEEEEEE